jgi:hypothetical protein
MGVGRRPAGLGLSARQAAPSIEMPYRSGWLAYKPFTVLGGMEEEAICIDNIT